MSENPIKTIEESIAKSAQLPDVTQAQKTRQITVPKLMLKQTLKLDIPYPKTIFSPLKKYTPPIFFPRAGGHDFSRGPRGLWAKWYKKQHRIKTPKQLWQAFGFTKQGKRKLKRKRRRKRK